MQKIIVNSMKSAVRNMELIWLIFIFSVIVKYLIADFQLSIEKIDNILKSFVFIALNLYLLSATLVAICREYKFGKWNWKDYLLGGLQEFPVILLWFLSVIFFTKIISRLIYGHESTGMWSGIVLVLIGYVTVFLPIEHANGNLIKKSVKNYVKLIKNNTVRWIITGFYVGSIGVATKMVIISLWSNAVRIENKLLIKFLILTSEFIRSAAIVVIMSTLIHFSLSNSYIIKHSKS